VLCAAVPKVLIHLYAMFRMQISLQLPFTRLSGMSASRVIMSTITENSLCAHALSSALREAAPANSSKDSSDNVHASRMQPL
jgi:hypothetical protein